MEKPKEELNPGEKIGKARVPNEDVAGWMEALREGGFTDQEIDRFFTGLNQEYAEQKLSSGDKERLEAYVKNFEKRFGKKMTPAEREHLFRAIEQDMDKRNKQK